MEESKHRKRLKKLKPNKPSSPSFIEDFIPKKSGASLSKDNNPKPLISSETKPVFEDDSSLDDFITDKVEYDRYGPPVSSSESAHSTDEEGGARKIHKRKSSSSSEESASDTSSLAESNEFIQEDLDLNEENKEPKKILVGKQALEEKRARGLIPNAPKKDKLENREKKHKKHDKHDRKSSKNHDKHKSKKYEEIVERKKKNKSPDNSKKYIQFKEFTTREEREKAEIVTKILARWWYIAEDWPPAGYDYSLALKQNNLRLVNKENWSVEPIEVDGLEKVKEVPGFQGLFMNHLGKVHDLRPAEICPCFNFYFKKSKKELLSLLLEALEKQLEVLNQQPKPDVQVQKDLRKEIEYYHKYSN
ncbi:unnamed protein product [Blepharisma stoltei]|uniref:Uncharacterized protein n=1 Tax=Blepharisma stoltei TaxID=1481888 RepID=A0AAU9JYU7_9CILI|nr:unnamed protein product [Blepharisma stoltei]